jgi:hypothetical protein
MSIKSTRVKKLMFAGDAFESFMAGRHLQSRVTNMSRARSTPEPGIRRFFVGMARDDHHSFLKCVAKVGKLERI